MDEVNWGTIATILIALSALITSVWAGIQQRKHNRLSVKPHITSWTHAEDNKFRFDLQNNGIGPAFIESFSLFVDGNKIEGNSSLVTEEVIKTIFPADEGFESHFEVSYLDDSYVMAKGESKTIALLDFNGEDRVTKSKILEAYGRADIEVVYRSVYGEVFTYSSFEIKKDKNALNDKETSSNSQFFKNDISSKALDFQFKYISHVLLAAALASSSILIARYSEKLLPVCPLCVKIAAIFVAFYGLGLSIYTAFTMLQEWMKQVKVKWNSFFKWLLFLVVGTFIALIAVFIVMSAFYSSEESKSHNGETTNVQQVQ